MEIKDASESLDIEGRCERYSGERALFSSHRPQFRRSIPYHVLRSSSGMTSPGMRREITQSTVQDEQKSKL